jgi:general secretion pathway protein J
MSRPLARRRQADAGFTLFEVLVAIALMGLIVGALATVTAQWMPSWNRSHIRTQRNEQVAIALDRLVADLSAAEYVSPNRVVNAPLFRGAESSIIFVRSAVGPNSRPGLEIVQIAETADKSGPALVRTRAPFVPLATGDPMVDPIPFTEPVVLLHAPLRVAFAYAGPDGAWENSWGNSSRKLGDLPAAVRFEILEGEAGPVVSTATRVHAGLRPPQPAQNDVAPPGAAQPQPNNAEAAK